MKLSNKRFPVAILLIFALSIPYVLDKAQSMLHKSEGGDIFQSQNADIMISSAGRNFTTLRINKSTLEVEMAGSKGERARGLSGRLSMPKDRGMLFVFEKPEIYGFWMKDMNFSIDIIWIDESKRIVDIMHSVFPTSYPEVFRPNTPVKYVLETNSGWVKENDVQIGDFVAY